jgi:hypothetical protein
VLNRLSGYVTIYFTFAYFVILFHTRFFSAVPILFMYILEFFIHLYFIASCKDFLSHSYSFLFLDPMDTVLSRDSPHPRDTLMSFSNLPAKRKSPGRAAAPPSHALDVRRSPIKVTNARTTKSTKKQQRVLVHAPAPTPRRQRGRPATTIAGGMTKNTFVKKCKDLNGAISQLKKCMFIKPFH